MDYYPIFLNLAGRKILVIGGGKVGLEKVRGLLAGGADDLTVISPDLLAGLLELKEAGSIAWRQATYRDGDLEGFDLCFVATDDGAVSAEVAAEGRRRRVWVNAADDPANCDFILPSVVRQGLITVAASTGGTSPAMARRLREDLTAFLSEEYGALAALLAEVRRDLRERGLRVDAATWSAAIDKTLRDLLREERTVEARAYLIDCLGVTEALTKPSR